MSYRHYTTREQAETQLAIERNAGRMGYILTLRRGCYELRVW